MHDVLRPEPEAGILPLTHAIEAQIRHIQDDARRSFGEKLSVEEALRVIDAGAKPYEFKMVPPEPECDTDEPRKFRRDLHLIELFLMDNGYDDDVIGEIFEDIKRFGSCWCSDHFAESDDARHCESLLNESGDWQHPKWDRIVVGSAL